MTPKFAIQISKLPVAVLELVLECVDHAHGFGECILISKFFEVAVKNVMKRSTQLRGILDITNSKTITFNGATTSWNEVGAWSNCSQMVLRLSKDMLPKFTTLQSMALKKWKKIDISSGHFCRGLNISSCVDLTIQGNGSGFSKLSSWAFADQTQITCKWWLRRCPNECKWNHAVAERIVEMRAEWVRRDNLAERYLQRGFLISGFAPRTVKLTIVESQSWYTCSSSVFEKEPMMLPPCSEFQITRVRSLDVFAYIDWNTVKQSLRVVHFGDVCADMVQQIPFKKWREEYLVIEVTLHCVNERTEQASFRRNVVCVGDSEHGWELSLDTLKCIAKFVRV